MSYLFKHYFGSHLMSTNKQGTIFCVFWDLKQKFVYRKINWELKSVAALKKIEKWLRKMKISYFNLTLPNPTLLNTVKVKVFDFLDLSTTSNIFKQVWQFEKKIAPEKFDHVECYFWIYQFTFYNILSKLKIYPYFCETNFLDHQEKFPVLFCIKIIA